MQFPINLSSLFSNQYNFLSNHALIRQQRAYVTLKYYQMNRGWRAEKLSNEHDSFSQWTVQILPCDITRKFFFIIYIYIIYHQQLYLTLNALNTGKLFLNTIKRQNFCRIMFCYWKTFRINKAQYSTLVDNEIYFLAEKNAKGYLLIGCVNIFESKKMSMSIFH